MHDFFAHGSAAGGGTGSFGSPWTLQEAYLNMANADRCFYAGTTTITAPLSPVAGAEWLLEGYQATPGDRGRSTILLDPSWSAGAAAVDPNGNGPTYHRVQNILIDGNGQDGSALTGTGARSYNRLDNIEVTGFAGSSDLVVNNHSTSTRLYVHDNTSTGIALNSAKGICECDVRNNGGVGVTVSNDAQCSNSIVVDNAYHGIAYFYGRFFISGCVIANNSGDNVSYYTSNSRTRYVSIINTILWNGGTANVAGSDNTSDGQCYFDNVYAGGDNGLDISSQSTVGSSLVASDPFVDSLNGDYTLATTGVGLALRQVVEQNSLRPFGRLFNSDGVGGGVGGVTGFTGVRYAGSRRIGT